MAAVSPHTREGGFSGIQVHSLMPGIGFEGNTKVALSAPRDPVAVRAGGVGFNPPLAGLGGGTPGPVLEPPPGSAILSRVGGGHWTQICVESAVAGQGRTEGSWAADSVGETFPSSTKQFPPEWGGRSKAGCPWQSQHGKSLVPAAGLGAALGCCCPSCWDSKDGVSCPAG